MREKMDLLKRLQSIDGELHDMRQAQQAYQGELAERQAACDEIRGVIDSLDQELDGLAQERRQMDIELQKEKDRIAHTESRLPQIKTQKEYVAVLKEVDIAKRDGRELEEAISSKDAAIDALKQERAEKQGSLDELVAGLETRKGELAPELEQMAKSLGTQGGEREALLKELPVTLRKRYDMLISRRQGLAVVGARAGACLGCNMHLPPQVFNNLYTMKDILTCPHCNRILYLADEGGAE